MSGDLLTPAQAARVLNVSTSRVRQLGDDGTLEVVRVPLGRLFVRQSVERVAQRRLREAFGAAA